MEIDIRKDDTIERIRFSDSCTVNIMHKNRIRIVQGDGSDAVEVLDKDIPNLINALEKAMAIKDNENG